MPASAALVKALASRPKYCTGLVGCTVSGVSTPMSRQCSACVQTNLNGISINHSLDVGGNWVKLGASDKAHEATYEDGESGHLGPEWQGQG